jgi:ankyrin repeat protein
MQDANDFPPNSQQSFVSDYGHPDSAFASQTTQPPTGDNEQPSRKRQRVLTPANSFGGLTPTYPQVDAYAANYPGSPTEPNESFIYSQAGVHVEQEPNYAPGPLRPLPYDMSPEAEAKRSLLMSLFMDPTGPDETNRNGLRNMIPQELDAPIDSQSHTALHWAATLSRMPLLRALIEAGASPFRVNEAGETALMRACIVTNSMDHNSFPELLDVLGVTIDVRDVKGRTVLHHIAVTSAVKGRNSASRYYLESLLEWVVRQGSAPSSQNAPGSLTAPAKMGIGRFMSEIVNAQDSSGDTALNIAARIGNRSIVSQLLEVGADPNIANRAGLRPLDFGIGTDAEDNRNGEGPEKNGTAQGASQKNRENSDEVVNCESAFGSSNFCPG